MQCLHHGWRGDGPSAHISVQSQPFLEYFSREAPIGLDPATFAEG